MLGVAACEPFADSVRQVLVAFCAGAGGAGGLVLEADGGHGCGGWRCADVGWELGGDEEMSPLNICKYVSRNRGREQRVLIGRESRGMEVRREEGSVCL